MTTVLSKTYTAKIEAFQQALSGARQNLTDAGKLLVEMLEENPDTFEIILRQCKSVTLRMLESLERIGRGKLDPLLLTDPSPAAQRAVSQALPMRDQQTLINKPVPVAFRDNGGVRIEPKRMVEMTVAEAARVIGPGKIRTPEEQIEIIKTQEADKAARNVRYEIRGDRITFHEGATFTWSELEAIAEKIKPKAVDIEANIKRNQIR